MKSKGYEPLKCNMICNKTGGPILTQAASRYPLLTRRQRRQLTRVPRGERKQAERDAAAMAANVAVNGCPNA